jgi:hypothetical protein
MPVKYFSRAGLCLTDWCDAACQCCYLRCGPDRTGWMDTASALAIWQALVDACPHPCRIHLTGGEPFGRWDPLIDLCEQAAARHLGPLEKVETNAGWAVDDQLVIQRIRHLDEVGMEKMSISADPFHQQFIPIDRPRRLARLVEEHLGPDRLQVRWEDWLANGDDIRQWSARRRNKLLIEWLAGGRDRLNGRAAQTLADQLTLHPPHHFADAPCREPLLRSKHVHVLPDRTVMPGVCAGIALGRLDEPLGGSVERLWQAVRDDHEHRPILSRLVRHGPVGLLELAEQAGITIRPAYASKCHLCWSIRRQLARTGLYPQELAPAALYRPSAP